MRIISTDHMDESAVKASWELIEMIDEAHFSRDPIIIAYVESLWQNCTGQFDGVWAQTQDHLAIWYTAQQFLDWWMPALEKYMKRLVP